MKQPWVRESELVYLCLSRSSIGRGCLQRYNQHVNGPRFFYLRAHPLTPLVVSHAIETFEKICSCGGGDLPTWMANVFYLMWVISGKCPSSFASVQMPTVRPASWATWRRTRTVGWPPPAWRAARARRRKRCCCCWHRAGCPVSSPSGASRSCSSPHRALSPNSSTTDPHWNTQQITITEKRLSRIAFCTNLCVCERVTLVWWGVQELHSSNITTDELYQSL